MFPSKRLGDVTVLAAPVELHARNAQAAREYMKERVKDGASRLAIDLSAVTFIDSSGLGALLTAFEVARGAPEVT